MTVTIKEITDKFYEVIDRYEGKRDYWELDENIINSEITSFFNEIDFHSKEPDDELFKIVKAYKIKKEFLVIFRSELEQVTVSYLEESEDLDDFVTAFAAFCTCVIRYDLVEKDDWTYYDALMSVVKSMSETSLPEYCDAYYSEIIKWLEIICNLIGNCEFRNQVFIEQLVELCNKGCPSFFALWFFCFYSQALCAEEFSEYLELISSSDDDLQKKINDMKPYRSDFFIEIKELYKAMNNDLKEYVLGRDKYLINDDTPLDEISDRHLLPFLYIGSLTGNLENELIRRYKQICNLFFYPNGRSLSIGNIIAYLNEENNSEEEKNKLCWNINLLFYYLNSNNFSKYTINNKQTIKHENKGKNNTMTDLFDLFIRRKLMPTLRTVPIFIPCVIPTPDFFKELLDKNIALDNALESKERLIRDFSHRFKNMRTTSLQNVGKALLAMDDKTLKKYGRKVMLEYGEKENIIKEVEILRLRYEDQQDQLLTLLHESQSEEPEGCNDIAGTVNKAVTRCVTTLLFDASDEPKLIRKSCLNNFDIVLLRNTFEEKVLYLEKPDAILWLNDYIMPVHFSFSDAWTKLYFKQDRGLDIILADLMTDLIMNAIKYADKSQVTSFDFTEEEDLLMIKTENMSVENKDDIPGSNTGLRSQNELLNYLNSACGYDNDSITVDSLPDDSFRAEIRLSRKIFTEDR